MLKLFRARQDMSKPASDLYTTIVERSRAPVFYADLGVPDAVIGRFEMIALHAFLVFRRLSTAGAEGRALSQHTHDLMFADMDRSLRELGIGDMGISKRVKSLARNLYGRIEAYSDGLSENEDVLVEALRRNVYATAEEAIADAQVVTLARYLTREATALADQTDAALLAGRVAFGTLPTLVPDTAGENL